MNKSLFEVGETVSLARWNATEHPRNHIAKSKVVAVKVGQHCESGVLVTLRIPDGGTIQFDQNWLAKTA